MIKRKIELYESKKYKKIIDTGGYTPVFHEWAVRFDLSPAELLIYSEIAHFTKITKKDGFGAFTAPISTLQTKFNMSYFTAYRALEKLTIRGLITKYKIPLEDGKKITAYRQATITQLSIDGTQNKVLK
ncbi:MAG: hypothetical protein J5911_01420 [Clostridia bacterium]|nr:hypothetical protein [Clostridia bacterium]